MKKSFEISPLLCKTMRFLLRKETVSCLEIYTDNKNYLLANMLSFHLHKKVRMIVLPSFHLNERLHQHFELDEQTNPVAIELLDSIIIEALSLKASDIHFYPEETHAKVVIRVAGNLINLSLLTLKEYESVLNRIKVLAHLPLAYARKNYDSHFIFSYKNCAYDIRVASLPCVKGELFVLRLFNHQQKALNLESLNYTPEVIESLQKILQFKQGLVLCTGPTGSGKTTCIYTLLNQLQAQKRHIITLEDPVEQKLVGIQQLSIKDHNELDYHQALSCVLRLDPDVLMIGEIRDEETAEQAVRLALTGHLVFSTVHSKDACATITRLLDLKVPSYLLSASLTAVIAHRLQMQEKIRVPQVEVLMIDDTIRSFIKNHEHETTIRHYLKDKGHQFIEDIMKGGDRSAL